MKIVWIFARLIVGMMMAYPGFSKLIEPVENFVAIIRNYEVIPDLLAIPVAYVLPWIEWICGALLVVGYMTRWMAMTLASLCFGFLMVIITALMVGVSPDIDCGCFGETGGHFNLWQVIIIDSIYLAVLIRLSFLKHFPLSLDALLLKPRKKIIKKRR